MTESLECGTSVLLKWYFMVQLSPFSKGVKYFEEIVLKKIVKLRVPLLLLIALFFLTTPIVVQASLFDDFIQEMNNQLQGGINDVKGLVKPRDKDVKDKEFTVESDITLAPDGDADNNGEMDGGDTVRFSFVLSNGTDTAHPFSNLKTNIKRDSIHFIHNIKGVTGIDNSTLELPNIYVLPNSKLEISFDARLNFSGEEEINAKGLAGRSIDADGNKEISSEPQLEDNKKQRLVQGTKKLKKYRAAVNRNGVRANLRNIEKESTSSAVVATELKTASPSAQAEPSKEASPTAAILPDTTASDSAKEEKNAISN